MSLRSSTKLLERQPLFFDFYIMSSFHDFERPGIWCYIILSASTHTQNISRVKWRNIFPEISLPVRIKLVLCDVTITFSSQERSVTWYDKPCMKRFSTSSNTHAEEVSKTSFIFLIIVLLYSYSCLYFLFIHLPSRSSLLILQWCYCSCAVLEVCTSPVLPCRVAAISLINREKGPHNRK